MKKNEWKLDDLPDLSGKTIIVTGGNTGLGFASVRAFISAGAEVIIAGRTPEKDEKARRAVLDEFPDARIHVMKLDLASLESIKEFADAFKGKFDRLDVLLNNAGIMMSPNFATRDGFEGQTGINHLGHFALTGRLLDLIMGTENARVVNVSSLAHKNGDADFEKMVYRNNGKYSTTRAYGRSKLANLLFTYELERYFRKNGSTAIAVAAHPGVTGTDLVRFLEKNIMVRLLKPLFGLWAQKPEMGALPQIRASADPQVRGGEYYGPAGRRELKGYPVKVDSSPLSKSQEAASLLWKKSEELTGVKFS